MPRRWIHAPCMVAALLLGWTGVSQAFWPFTRAVKAVPDSVRERDWKARFDTWKSQSEDSLATGTRAVAPGVAAAPGVASAPTPAGTAAPDTTQAPAGTPSMQDLVLQAQQEARADSLATDASGAALADSVQGAAVAPPGDTTTSNAALEAAARAQAKQDAEADIQARIAAASAEAGFRPRFSSKLVSSNDRMDLDSSLNASFNDPSGVLLSTGLTYNDEYNLNQNTNTRSRGMINSFTLPFRDQGMNFSLRTTNSRRDVLGARTTTNERTTTLTDNRNASLTASIGRQLVRGVGANASYSVDFRYGSQDIKATGTSSGDRQNKTQGQSYGVGMNFDRLTWLQLDGRLARAVDNNTDITSSFITPDNPSGEQSSSSRGDSVTATVSMPLGPILPLVSANYRLTSGRRSFTDPARTSSGGTGGGGTFVLETEQRYMRTLQMRSTFVPVNRLRMDLSYEVGRDSVGYAVRNNAYNDTKRQSWSVKGNLQYHPKGTINVNFEYGRTDVNRDEVGRLPNPQTRSDRDKRLTGDITQVWIGTLKTRLYGEMRLSQGFYVHEGPQGLGDRDDYRTQYGLDIDGTINRKMSAALQSYVRTFNQAFIDPRRSISSRDETEYVLRMDFRYQITPTFKLSQRYGLSSKVLDEIHNPLRNTLNRNHFLQTNWDYLFNKRLTFSGLFNYILQDNGAYLDDPKTRSLERFFSPTQENRKHEAKVDLRYALLPDGMLGISSSQQVVRDRRTSFNNGEISSITTTRRSNLALGVDSTIKMGDLQLNSRATRNQNLNSSINRNVFYNIDATLTYTF